MDSNHDFSCGYGEQTLDYLYGEIERTEKIKYEAHLENCPNCADELAGFGFVRASITDWKTASFSNLKTPILDTGFIKSADGKSIADASNKTSGWFEGFRKVFSFNAGFAAAALAVTVFCVGIVWFAPNFSGSKNYDVAGNADNINSLKTAASPTIEVNPAVRKEAATSKETKSKAESENAEFSKQLPKENKTAFTESAVKISSDASNSTADNLIRRPKTSGENPKKSPPAQKKKVPNLNDSEDEEDETIRLADLFAELDTK